MYDKRPLLGRSFFVVVVVFAVLYKSGFWRVARACCAFLFWNLIFGFYYHRQVIHARYICVLFFFFAQNSLLSISIQMREEVEV